MRVHFHADNPAALRFRPQITESLVRSLRRLKWMVASVKVHFGAIDSLAGGVDKRCRVEVKIRGAAVVAMSGAARSWHEALEAVATRVRNRVVARVQARGLLQSESRQSRSMALAAPIGRAKGVA